MNGRQMEEEKPKNTKISSRGGEGSLYMPKEGLISKRGEFSETTADLVTASAEQSVIKR